MGCSSGRIRQGALLCGECDSIPATYDLRQAGILREDRGFHFPLSPQCMMCLLVGPRPYPGPIKLVTILHPDPHHKTKCAQIGAAPLCMPCNAHTCTVLFDAVRRLTSVNRHRKRRVVQPSLVEHLASILPAGGLVVLQSDEQDVASDMRTCFEQHGRSAFRPVGDSDWDVCCHVLSGAKDREKVRLSADSWVPAIPSVCEHSDAPVGANVRERCSDGPCDEDGWHRSCLPVPSDREVICQLNGLPIYRTVLVRF